MTRRKAVAGLGMLPPVAESRTARIWRVRGTTLAERHAWKGAVHAAERVLALQRLWFQGYHR